MKFLVSAKDKQGVAQSKVIETGSLNEAVAIAQAQGLYVMNIQPLEEKAERLAIQEATRAFSHNSVSLQDIMSFARQLATMLSAGVPLLRSLNVITAQVESRGLANILSEVCVDVEGGIPFSKALSKHPRYFDQFWVSLVEIGEASGTMPQVLLKLTSYMEEAAKFRGQIIGALVYPAILFVISMGAVLFFALFVGPTFERIFKEMGTQLPGFTVMMLAIFRFIKDYFFFIILAMVALFFVLKAYIQTPFGRRQSEIIAFGLPVFGPLIKLVVIEKFTSQMALLIDSGVPIIYALEISERLVDNTICAEVIVSVREAVKEGKLLAEPMERSGFFPPMAVQMVRVGEETGELGKMMNHVAVYYKQAIEEFMKRFATMVEPNMLVFMGGIIGVIVISMFLPMFNLAG
jgi:type IV pilus assembly protein PilC